MTDSDHDKLALYFRQVTGAPPTEITPLRPHASERCIFRLTSPSTHLIGVINPNRRENDAFVAFARYFRSHGLPVPEIVLYQPEENLYLEEDLGDDTLLDVLSRERAHSQEDFPASVESLYKQALEWLPRFQIDTAKEFDFSRCHPERHLLPGTFTGDCTAFATELIRRILPHYDITGLAPDFARLIDFLEKAHASFFVYRDFQSRNIMCNQGGLHFIDFQSGSQGPLQYDVVSLLYQSSATIPREARARLVAHYCQAAACYTTIDIDQFYHFYSSFIVSRMIQVLGVYGRQGLGAGKEYFTRSIPAAVVTLVDELARPDAVLQLSTLHSCAQHLSDALSRTPLT
jgi:aminoglycoside/choline kinase family phosphotransferase